MMSSTLTANAIYSYPSLRVGLRIGTGGSGQSGLLQALAEAFIKYCSTQQGYEPFCIEWYTSDTTVSLDYLSKQFVDVGITYHAIAEHTAWEAGVIDRVEYIFRDHWMLVGPKEDPAGLHKVDTSNVYQLFTKLFSALEEHQNDEKPIMFLSRYDKSAGNIAESTIWATIGQTPWAKTASKWYNKLGDFPFQAIRKAAELGQYTITDRGTWCAIESEVRDKLQSFAEGGEDEMDPLLNPAHLVVGTKAKNKEMATKFADWIIRDDGGQEVIKNFTKNDMVLYDVAPKGVDPMAKANAILGTEASASAVRAAINLPVNENEMYFWKDDKYVRIDAIKDTISYTNAKLIKDMWPALAGQNFKKVNSILPIPGSYDAWFFSKHSCLRMNTVDGNLTQASFDWRERWPALKGVGFDNIDAVLPWVLHSSSTAYFFCKTKCIAIDVNNGNVVYGVETITTRFKALDKAGFKNIEAACFKPGKGQKEAYYFSGDRYVLVDLPGDYIAWGPLEVKDSWKSLAACEFY